MSEQSSESHTPPLGPSSLLGGFHETYRRLGVSAQSSFQAAAHAVAVAELLIAKGLIGVEELNDRQRKVEERLRAGLADNGMMVQLADEPDKYTMDDATATIDCENRLPLCHAACCRLRFALTEQDIHEGVVQWEVGQPYLNRQRADGYCIHCSDETKTCTVYEQRPSICRRYDCRHDKRIWLDFEQRVINPELFSEPTDGSAQPASPAG